MIAAYLLGLLMILAIPNWIVALILVRAAWRKPRIRFLSLTAAGAVLVAAGILAYVLAVVNGQFDYPVPLETARVVFRLILVGIAIYPFLWLRDYLTGGFGR